MLTTKLTLSADPAIISIAKQTAAQRHTSVSSMFARFIKAIEKASAESVDIAPITQRASGLVKLSKKKDRDLIEDALISHYGLEL